VFATDLLALELERALAAPLARLHVRDPRRASAAREALRRVREGGDAARELRIHLGMATVQGRLEPDALEDARRLLRGLSRLRPRAR
jgi:hypothetical protein